MAALRTFKVLVVRQVASSRATLLSNARALHTTLGYACPEKNAEGKFEDADAEPHHEEFKVFEIPGLEYKTPEPRKKRFQKKAFPPRFRSMSTDQDWTDVWPTASTFKWSAVPFPVRQGFVERSSENEGVVPSKYANLELMKGPNFLHLTPAHIKKHCQALKQFCTPWPEGLETDERCRKHYPVETSTSDYLNPSPSVRDSRARFATLEIHLSDLVLDYHAKDKFIRLVGDSYNKETDIVTLTSGRCPLKSQNMEYIKFLLTAVYFESWKRESWEDLKELSDMEKYVWDMNTSKKTCMSLLKTIKDTDSASESTEGRLSYLPDNCDDETLSSLPEVQQYKVAVEELFNEGENIETINNYKNAVKNLLNLKSDVS